MRHCFNPLRVASSISTGEHDVEQVKIFMFQSAKRRPFDFHDGVWKFQAAVVLFQCAKESRLYVTQRAKCKERSAKAEGIKTHRLALCSPSSAKSRVFDFHHMLTIRGVKTATRFNPLRVTSSISTTADLVEALTVAKFQSAKSRVFDFHVQ